MSIKCSLIERVNILSNLKKNKRSTPEEGKPVLKRKFRECPEGAPWGSATPDDTFIPIPVIRILIAGLFEPGACPLPDYAFRFPSPRHSAGTRVPSILFLPRMMSRKGLKTSVKITDALNVFISCHCPLLHLSRALFFSTWTGIRAWERER